MKRDTVKLIALVTVVVMFLTTVGTLTISLIYGR